MKKLAVFLSCLLLFGGPLFGCSAKPSGPPVASTDNGSAKPSASAPVDKAEANRQFAKCMREHGVDMPDPDPNTGMSAILNSGIDFNSPTFKAATEACKGLVGR
jgi:hypothetical protein